MIPVLALDIKIYGQWFTTEKRFTLGMVQYLVVFVTLYQRLSGSDQLPVMLRPVFFLFFAAPSMASLAENKRAENKNAH